MENWNNPNVHQEWSDSQLHPYYRTTIVGKKEAALQVLTWRNDDCGRDITAVLSARCPAGTELGALPAGSRLIFVTM